MSPRTPAEEERLIGEYQQRDTHRALAIRVFGREAVYRLHLVANTARSRFWQEERDREVRAAERTSLLVADHLEAARAAATSRGEAAASPRSVFDAEPWRRAAELVGEALELVRAEAATCSALLQASARVGALKRDGGLPSVRRTFIAAVLEAHPEAAKASPAAWAHLAIALGVDRPTAAAKFKDLSTTYRALLRGRSRSRARGKRRRS